jgi:thiol-disulfide isomerase/thioredoxin
MTLLTLAALVAVAPAQQPRPIVFSLVPQATALDFEGSRARNLVYSPSRIELKPQPPAHVTVTPLAPGLYGELSLGNAPEGKLTVYVSGGTLQIDANRNGDFSDDPEITVTTVPPTEAGRPETYRATVALDAVYRNGNRRWTSPYGLNFYWPQGSNAVFYYRAGLLAGKGKLGNRDVEVELYENANTGVFGERWDMTETPLTLRPSTLRIQGGSYNVRGTITIDGVNYLPEISVDGRQVRLVPSVRVVAAPTRPSPNVALLASGTAAPDFSVDRFEGGTTKLSEQKGKVVILKFWASWCGPCKASMPHFEEIYQKTRAQGVALMAVAVSDERPAATAYVEANKAKFTFPFFYDPAGRSPENISRKLYGVSGIPTVVIIDREGKVAENIVGYNGVDDKRVEAALKKLGVNAD